MSNPFDALNISDDEDEQFTTAGNDKVRKSICVFYTQLTKKEENSKNNPKPFHQHKLKLTQKSLSTEQRKQEININIKGKLADLSKEFPKDILSTEEAEPAEPTDQENKAEVTETLVMPKTKSTMTSTKSQLRKLLNQLKSSHLSNKQNLNNHKSQPSLSTIKARVSS